ncbi:MAG: proline--tRNA ligase [Bacillota bacterium]
MRMTGRFGKNLREKPAEAEMPSHELLLRSAMIAKVAAGIYDYLPLGYRAYKKIMDIMRREMDAVDGQEINMPVTQPAELWQESGRWQKIGPELARFKDRSGRDMVLAMTHEESVTDLIRRHVDSYKQLPFVLYHIQTKFRDEPRSRGGLVRVREFTMKDAYSFHRDNEDLDRYYPSQCRAYRRICQTCGVPVVQVLSDVGMMGGSQAHEFTYVTDVGEDTLILCRDCGYAANREVATLRKFQSEEEKTPQGAAPAMEKVATPGKDTIASVCEFLGADPKDSIKTMVYYAGDRPVVVVIRGDLDVNERKLANLLQVEEALLANPEDLKKLGLVKGYMSPAGLTGITVITDDSLVDGRAYVAGANEEGFHLKNVVPGRDYKAETRADIAAARDGDPCPVCGKPLSVARGIEVGNTFKLGTRYSAAMGANYQDESGQEHPIVMGCYGMGVGRLLACVVEANHDERGIIWPMTVAPYHVHIVALGSSPEVKEAADALYEDLQRQGTEVLYDDRDESAGVKFNDADLMGMPIRITVSARSLKEGGCELKLRREQSGKVVALAATPALVAGIVASEIERLQPKEE